MVASLLPGFREIRNPVVIGTLWMVATWLFVAERKPEVTRGGIDTHAGLGELVEFAGRPGVTLALGFIAYLLGSAYLALIEGVRHRTSEAYLRRYPDPGSNWHILERPLRPPIIQEILDRFGRPISHWSKQRLYDSVYSTARQLLQNAGVDAAEIPNVAAETARSSMSEVMNIGPRLLVGHPNLYQEFDRWRSEARLRDGLVIPLAIAAWQLMIALGWSGSQLLLGALGLCLLGLVLLYVGDNGHRRAYSLIAHSLASGAVEPASLQALRERYPSVARPASNGA